MDARLVTGFRQLASDYSTQENDHPRPLFLTQLVFPSAPALSSLFLFLLDWPLLGGLYVPTSLYLYLTYFWASSQL